MNRRKLLLGSGVALTTTIAGCSSDTSDDGENGNGNGTSTGPSADEPDVEEPDPISVSGSGNQVYSNVGIIGGLTVIEAQHTGSRNFIVKLVPETGMENIMVNQIGAFDGSRAALVGRGTYQMSIEADGDWELELTQPRPSSGDSLPFEQQGTSATVLGPLEFDGTHTIGAAHNGRRNFIVQVLPPQGQFPTIAVNEIGSYEGTTSFRHSGLGYVAIQADGGWGIRIE
ncbi:hypothetical protein NP511_02215 [Natrinema thermotolerans]|uniref:Uncharacterized protein n=1 Tax=Natrinema thermotolerans TaxID=121872 RepID=A0AAF0PD86_9EURY|nr:hypothetical protein [Natrinema thermotolerans]WPH65874.1 hypothetical protein HJTV4_gp52 [Haloarchaeal virus HJTV-4]QCC60778.1 hypothetical protein DVR14_19905 [Natrinema thermotolerans]QCC61657.1 hypothetical protein DVR14_24045 [Natrinema thermotolerans]WMT07824.1 hypothetical protein NP511_20930 [Natrinema thermotolerans]WMT08456.1 hypothetical protein NP511_02215 [Natrinema thermotolerans]